MSLIVLGACAQDCSCREGCGEGGVELGAAPASAPSGAAGGGAPEENGPRAGASGSATAPAVGAPRGPDQDAGPNTHGVLGEFVDSATLQAPLSNRVGALVASAPAVSGAQEHEQKPVRSVIRSYTRGSQDLYVEIIDTAQAPELRELARRELEQQTGSSGDVQRQQASLAGSPALGTDVPKQQTSGVVALLGGRYLVKARLKGSEGPQAALALLSKMDWSSLAKPQAEGAGGGGAR